MVATDNHVEEVTRAAQDVMDVAIHVYVSQMFHMVRALTGCVHSCVSW